MKDERNLDKFDRVFGSVFKGLESLLDAMDKAEIPEEWLKKLAEKYLTEEEKKQIEAMGWDKLMETLRKRLEEQKGRHQGGARQIVEVLDRLIGEVGVERLHQRQIFAQGHRDLRVAQRCEELQEHGIQIARRTAPVKSQRMPKPSA